MIEQRSEDWFAARLGKVTASKVKELEKRLAAVEEERDGLKHKLRVSVRHVRDWMAWALQHAPGVAPPPMPVELADEV